MSKGADALKKRIYVLLVMAFFLLVFSGCGSRTAADMYCLPRRSSEYKNLQTVIDTAMNELDYAAPLSGDNRQPVQTADLNGDGTDEYLVFAKGTGEKPLKILVFRQLPDDKFELQEEISCKGAAFEQVQYVEFDGYSGVDLVVGRRINDQVTKIASVFSFASGQSEQVMSSIYAKFLTCDLDEDGATELIVIRNGEAEASNAVAVMYGYKDGAVERSVEAGLSVRAEQIRRITTNVLSSGETAIYVASALSEQAVITDVFALKNQVLTNISLSSDFGTSVQTLRNYYVYAEDIDSDGMLELPSLVPMRYITLMADTAEQDLIRWYNLDINGSETDKMYTFHNFLEGWYVELESSWINRIAVEENGAAHTFYMWNDNYGEAMAVFTIFTLTGRDRDSQAAVQNRFALYRGENVVYAGKLESASAIYGITEAYLVDSFHLIRQDWKNGDT